jgi:hypothetical protein
VFVSLTATGDAEDVFILDDEDAARPVVRRRVHAAKPVHLSAATDKTSGYRRHDREHRAPGVWVGLNGAMRVTPAEGRPWWVSSARWADVGKTQAPVPPRLVIAGADHSAAAAPCHFWLTVTPKTSRTSV